MDAACCKTKRRLKNFQTTSASALAYVDVRTFMQFAQQVDFRLFGFLARQILTYGVVLTLFGRAGVTDIVQLDDVPAELRAYGWADLTGFEFCGWFLQTAQPSCLLRRKSVV